MKRIFINMEISMVKTKTVINFNLNYKISSFIYSLLLEDLPEIHSDKERRFTFSNIEFDNYKRFFVDGKNVGFELISNKAGFVISTSDEKIFDTIVNNIKYNKFYNIDNFHFKIKSIKIDSDKIIGSMCGFKTLTPICLSTGIISNDKLKSKYITPFDDGYNEALKKNILKKIKSDVNLDIHINKDSIKRRKISLQNENIFAIGYDYEFLIICDDINVINKSYFDGFGSKNSQGFGMVKLIKQQ